MSVNNEALFDALLLNNDLLQVIAAGGVDGLTADPGKLAVLETILTAVRQARSTSGGSLEEA